MQISSVTCLYIRCLDTSVFNFQNDKNRHFLGVLSKRNIYSASNYCFPTTSLCEKDTYILFFSDAPVSNFRNRISIIFFSAMPVTEEHFLHLSFFCDARLMRHVPLFINLGHCFCLIIETGKN
jgi:hypothetical protein